MGVTYIGVFHASTITAKGGARYPCCQPDRHWRFGAILLANNFGVIDTIEFDPSLTGGTITLALGELAIADDLTITGLGAANLTVSGNNASRVFNIDDGDVGNEIVVTISGLIITGGNVQADGGGIFNAENLTLQDSILSGNDANVVPVLYTGGRGGGLFNSGTAALTGSTVDGNDSYLGGGGVYNTGILTVTDSVITGNEAAFGEDGGGLYNAIGGTLSVADSTISGNCAGQDGGGIRNRGSLDLRYSTLSGNDGGDGSDNSGDAVIFGANISGNDGGGGVTNGGDLVLTQCSVGRLARGGHLRLWFWRRSPGERRLGLQRVRWHRSG